MLSSALGDAWGRIRRTAGLLGSVVVPSTRTGCSDEWTFTTSSDTEVRWTCGDEAVTCFRFDDGYVATVTYESREVTWQLTPGPVPLGSALASVVLYQDHGVTPQLDREGRPFVALAESGPRQVFEEIADEPVEYRYLDGIRTPEEFPTCLDVRSDVEDAFDDLSPMETQTQNGE